MFTKTKNQLNVLSNGLEKRLNNTSLQQQAIISTSKKNSEPSQISRLINCYQFNAETIGILNKIVQAIELGNVNNIERYTEADLFFSKTIFDVHHQAKTFNQYDIPEILEVSEIIHLILKQIRYFKFIIDLFPDNYGTNYRKKLPGIAEIPLDLYQIIHIACLNLNAQLKAIELQYHFTGFPLNKASERSTGYARQNFC